SAAVFVIAGSLQITFYLNLHLAGITTHYVIFSRLYAFIANVPAPLALWHSRCKTAKWLVGMAKMANSHRLLKWDIFYINFVCAWACKLCLCWRGWLNWFSWRCFFSSWCTTKHFGCGLVLILPTGGLGGCSFTLGFSGKRYYCVGYNLAN